MFRRSFPAPSAPWWVWKSGAGRDRRGNLHAIHHWQARVGRVQHNAYFNGGHSFSRDGSNWTFSPVASYTKNISFTDGSWSVMGRRERPGLLLDENWSTPLVLFTSVGSPHGPESWLQSQPIRQTADPAQGGGACRADEDCNLNGVCAAGKCACDAQWDGATCGVLALEPASKDGGYRRPGFNGWGGNPWYDPHDKRYHVFTVEMTKGCLINDCTRAALLRIPRLQSR